MGHWHPTVTLDAPVSLFSIPSPPVLGGNHRIGEAGEGDMGGAERGGRNEGYAAYAIQMSADIAVGIDNGLVATQLDNLSDDDNVFADIRVEVGAGNAGVGGGLHFR